MPYTLQAYLDNNATTLPAPEAVDAMQPYLREVYGNPSSAHTFGGRAQHAVAKAREQVAALLGCTGVEVLFTSCGTEGDNAAIVAALDALPSRKHIITTRVEHPAVLSPLRHLATRGYRVTELNVDRQGGIDLEELRREISGDTALVSVMWANNETGVIFPVHEVGEIAKQNGAMFHVDAVQSPGKVKLDLAKEAAIDFLAISAHKFHGVKGAGALFVRKGTRFRPLIHGGEQERGRRGGTENVPGIVAMGVAAELVLKDFDAAVTRVAALRDRLEAGLLAKCDHVVVNGDRDHRLCNTLNVGFEFIEGESILLMLDTLGIAVSSGSACSSGSLEPSHVLRAMSVPFTAVHGSIRFSLGRYSTDKDVDYVLEKVPPVIKRLREISPFGRQAPNEKAEAERRREKIESGRRFFGKRPEQHRV
ncbi:MAG: cysteine desulfurase NifS [Planctomycetes bacterium]|nr:cysteine desulfurase NifS [Planctomycetota bacterium]